MVQQLTKAGLMQQQSKAIEEHRENSRREKDQSLPAPPSLSNTEGAKAREKRMQDYSCHKSD